MQRRRVVIMGAAGRDFHNFNVLYRGHPEYEVVAFTAAQIPNITGRAYPPVLAGPDYPNGIPIVPEEELTGLVREQKVDLVVLAYSDLPHIEVMHKASTALAAGASFLLAGPRETMLPSTKPVPERLRGSNGHGKSPLTRFVSRTLRSRGYRVAIVRHPMPYGDLATQAVQRFAQMETSTRPDCTIEEREEYEPHLRDGAVVFAGVDYEAILRRAEAEADLVLWDGGNNDFSFYRPDLQIVVADPHRPGHELSYYPGRPTSGWRTSSWSARLIRPCPRMWPRSKPTPPGSIPRRRSSGAPWGSRLKIPSDFGVIGCWSSRMDRRSPTAEWPTGPAPCSARAHGALLVDARPFAVGSIARVYEQYPHLHSILPAMGYSPEQIGELEETIRRSGAEFVVDGSPIDLSHLVHVEAPLVNVAYQYEDIGQRMTQVLERFAHRYLTLPPVPDRLAKPVAGVT